MQSSCSALFARRLQSARKALIYKHFSSFPHDLWITLLMTRLHLRETATLT